MVKILALLSALALILPVNVQYACMEDGATLYNYSDGAYVAVADLPDTYFVAVIKNNDDGYSLVNYMDISGYVKTSDIRAVDFTPKYKYADVTFTVANDSQPANLRSRPDHLDNSNVLCVMPNGGSGKVIGSVEGSALIANAGKIWYYVRYENGSDFTYGYVYYAHVAEVNFPQNSYEREEVKDSGIENGQTQPAMEMSLPVQILLIIVLCLPVAVIMLMMFSSKQKRTPRHARNDDKDDA